MTPAARTASRTAPKRARRRAWHPQVSDAPASPAGSPHRGRRVGRARRRAGWDWHLLADTWPMSVCAGWGGDGGGKTRDVAAAAVDAGAGVHGGVHVAAGYHRGERGAAVDPARLACEP